MAYTASDGIRYDINLGDSPRLKAAFEVALAAHEGQTRDDQVTPYITHPILVYKILDRFGCDETTKAIGLLHDTLEDCKEWHHQPEQLSDALYEKLSRSKTRPHALRAIREWTDTVANIVGDYLTNPPDKENQPKAQKYPAGDKRGYQTDKTSIAPSPRERVVKIADQAASVIDDIVRGDTSDITKMNKKLTFALKGRDIAQAAIRNVDVVGMTDEDAKALLSSINNFRIFYNQLYGELVQLYEITIDDTLTDAQKKAKIAESRSTYISGNNSGEAHFLSIIPDILEAPQQFSRKIEKPDAVNVSDRDAEIGLRVVQCAALLEKGENELYVTGYRMVIDSNAGPENEKNKLAEALRSAIEGMRGPIIETRQLHKKAELLNGKIVQARDYVLSEPIPAKKFIEVAEGIGALGPVIKGNLISEMRGLLDAPEAHKRNSNSDRAR